MNEMQAHGLLIPVGSKPFEVWIDKNNSLAELQDLVNGNVDVLSVLGNGVDLWVNEEGLINGSKPNRAIYATKHMEEVGISRSADVRPSRQGRGTLFANLR